jgi:cytochrome P450
MLENDATLPPEESELDLIKDIAGITYLGGADTTTASVVAYFLAMLIYPDVQAKAQVEVDRVVGKTRLPEMDDKAEMPYVQGVVNECLRWLPVTPLGKLPSICNLLDILGLIALAVSSPTRRIS